MKKDSFKKAKTETFLLTVEDRGPEKVKVEVAIDKNIDPAALADTLYTACHTLNHTVPHVLKSFFYSALQVVKEDPQVIAKLEDIIQEERNCLVSKATLGVPDT
ncbi:MAG: hypothetical protein WBA74_13330 [Cyclobacteriaceae bacterium]